MCDISVTVQCPVHPPCAVDGCSRNHLYYYYYYRVQNVFPKHILEHLRAAISFQISFDLTKYFSKF